MQYFWVMGPSGVGKKTLLLRLRNDASLRSRLGIPDGFAAVGPGFNGQSAPESRAEDLAKLDAPAVVIKWQAAGDQDLERLKALRPDAEHVILFLQRPAELIHRDLKVRSPESEETREGIAAFSRNNLEASRQRVSKGFRLVILDAQEHAYRSLP